MHTHYTISKSNELWGLVDSWRLALEENNRQIRFERGYDSWIHMGTNNSSEPVAMA